MNSTRKIRAEAAVQQRYRSAAKISEVALSCPVEYNHNLLNHPSSDEDVPEAMQLDPTLWSGCISGALREDLFLKAFEDAGFYGIHPLKRDEKPWQTVEGIEFRSVTVEAFEGKQGDCFEVNQAVTHRGPFLEVLDDDGHRVRRGERVAVCDKTLQLYRKAPYAGQFEFVERRVPVNPGQAKPYDCSRA